MKLLTKEILKDFAKTGSQEGIENPRIIVKFFGGGSYSFFATEYNPETKTFFGFTKGLDEQEWGYTSLAELESVKFAFGMGIERDMYFENKYINDIKSYA